MKKNNVFFCLTYLIGSIVASMSLLRADPCPDVVLVQDSDSSLFTLAKPVQWLYEHIKTHINAQLVPMDKVTADALNSRVLFFGSLSGTARQSFFLLPSIDQAIKIAYSVWEADAIPPYWISELNTYFDAVVVADDFLEKLYKSSGVLIPIFVLPHGSYLEDWMKLVPPPLPAKPFVFSMSGSYYFKQFPRKNHDILIDAFEKAFAQHQDVRLKIHIRKSGSQVESVRSLLKRFAFKKHGGIDWQRGNITISFGDLSDDEYKNFVASSHCYLQISSGEGFSMSPREALAVGIPTIVTDNTAQTTICNSGFVRSVPCTIEVPFEYGKQLRPTVDAVAEGMLDVYRHHQRYREYAFQAKTWLYQYTADGLIPRYLSLFKPQKVILGDGNEITKECLITNSEKLYHKYQNLGGL